MSSKRRLSYTEESRVQICTLCKTANHQTSTPGKWRNSEARKLALSFRDVISISPVCKPCRDDISKCLVDTSHIPRWGKKTAKTRKCIIVNCDKAADHSTSLFTDLQMMTQQAGLQFDTLSVPTLLCNSHYHVLYNTKNPTQTNCSTCSVSIKYTRNRTCPDPNVIEVHLRKKTGFEGKICPDSSICNTCYKLHLHNNTKRKKVR